MNQTEARVVNAMMYASEIASLAPSRWERWLEAAEKILGLDLDGDGEIDGYSLDDAYNQYVAGLTVGQYVEKVRESIKRLATAAGTENPAGTPDTQTAQ